MDWIREHPERIVNSLPTASHPLAGLRQGGKTVEKRHRVLRRTGAVVEAACSIRRIILVRFSGSIAFRRPGLHRIGISSGSLVSNTAASMSQRGAGAGLGIGLRQGWRCRRPQQRDIPVDRVPGPTERRHQTVGTR